MLLVDHNLRERTRLRLEIDRGTRLILEIEAGLVEVQPIPDKQTDIFIRKNSYTKFPYIFTYRVILLYVHF